MGHEYDMAVEAACVEVDAIIDELDELVGEMGLD